MNDDFAELRERLGTLADLHNVSGLLGWDQQTMMPARGGESRAEALATIERMGHEFFIDDETGRILEDAAARLAGADLDDDLPRVVSVTRRRWEKARRIPSELAADMARAASLGQEAWVEARANNDYSGFAGYLARNFELARALVDCSEGFDCAYDALLDDYDPGMRTAEVSRLFTDLVSELRPILAAVEGREIDRAPVLGHHPVERQRALCLEVLSLMGFDRAGWRLDEAVHPFASGFGSGDIRLTTRFDEGYFPSALFATMHECGHGLYEEGIAPALQRTPLQHAESLSLHESQSRMWENMVGRGRPFADALAPRLESHLGLRVEPGTLFAAANALRQSFIRVEADEATYGLHIVLRFELEQELIEGRLDIADLPDAWNTRYRELFGVSVPDDRLGVLQDVHWSAGIIGYFPTYALGNLIAGHLWRRVRADLPDLDDSLARGELTVLREWLREHVHRHGSKFDSRELLARVTGEELSVEPFADYLREKVSDVYGVTF